ncbi:torsin-1A isoform X1 [Armigeres subalbatus]|uniref:torsin-1A isoform X1 n=1 Tax=Armigeres subalbatus TaxID=124917 RepID=UPI002ED408BC
MLLRKSTSVCLLLLSIHVSVLAAFEPFSFTTAAIGAGLGWLKWDSVMDNTYCKAYECCRKPYLKWNVEGLKHDLKNFLYGQHIVEDVLVNAIGAHLDNIESSRKPLVLSFHGTSGVGKTYVSQLVIANLFEMADRSSFVQRFSGRIPFTSSSLIETHKVKLQNTILESLRDCPQSLFIFDDVEEMPPGILNYIVHILDHNLILDGVSLSKAIFIFISNIGGVEISQILRNLLENGGTRENADFHDFESALQLASYDSENNGFFRSQLIDSYVVDYFVPFLPLEESHVRSCIMQEFFLLNITEQQIDDDMLRKITRHITFDGIFVNGGCKRITKKVGALVREYFG